jgi:hypothetical protein
MRNKACYTAQHKAATVVSERTAAGALEPLPLPLRPPVALGICAAASDARHEPQHHHDQSRHLRVDIRGYHELSTPTKLPHINVGNAENGPFPLPPLYSR